MRNTPILLVFLCLAFVTDATAQESSADDRIQDLERRIQELEAREALPKFPPKWAGTWRGKLSADVPTGECKYVFRPAMDMWLSFNGEKVVGEATARTSMRLVVPISGDLGADGIWRGFARGYAASAWAIDMWFSGDLLAGTGTWRETSYGCPGKFSLAREE